MKTAHRFIVKIILGSLILSLALVGITAGGAEAAQYPSQIKRGIKK